MTAKKTTNSKSKKPVAGKAKAAVGAKSVKAKAPKSPAASVKKPVKSPAASAKKPAKPTAKKQVAAKPAKKGGVKSKSVSAKPSKAPVVRKSAGAVAAKTPKKGVSAKKPSAASAKAVKAKPASAKAKAKPAAPKALAKAKAPISKPASAPVKAPANKKHPAPVKRTKSDDRHFTAEELAEFHRMMVDWAKRLTNQADELREQSLLRHDEVNHDEDGTDAFERVTRLDRASADQAQVFQINKAIEAIKDGTYGLCDACGCKIERSRLKALPFVQTCIECQSKLEDGGRGKRSTDLWD